MKKRVEIARDVIAGYYGSGTKRTAKLKKEGYNPDVVQGDVNTLLCCRENIINNIKAMAKTIAANNNWWYIYWNEKYGHECAICHPHGGANHGWQCIGFGIACWHHGGLPIPCNCGVLDNGTCEKILKAKTDSEALKIAQKELGIKDIKVIRNGGKAIPKSKVKPGDIMLLYTGNEFQHLVLNMSDSKVADSTQGATNADDIRADRNFDGRYVSRLKVLIRYTGNGLCSAPKRTIDELAHEVIEGLWGSGDSRVKALKEAGHDYDKVQKRVNEILNPPKPKPTPTPTPEPTPSGHYTGKYPSYRLVKTNAQVIADVIKYATWICNNNDFHYGAGESAHKCGCYFCGTQPKSKKSAGIKMWEHSQCCNPFVHSCWAHGGCLPNWLKVCQRGGSYDWNSMPVKDFKKVSGTPKKGDIVCKVGHIAISAGGNTVYQASGGDDNVPYSKRWNNSISKGTWSGYTDVYRYTGSINTDLVIYPGEVSDRIYDLQNYLDWYFDGTFFKACGPADGCYGENTLKYVKKMQTDFFGAKEADGTIGPKTIAKMKEVTK